MNFGKLNQKQVHWRGIRWEIWDEIWDEICDGIRWKNKPKLTRLNL